MNFGPSTRDLISFISPNATKQDRLVLCHNMKSLAGEAGIRTIKKWEEEEICALVLAAPAPEKFPQEFLTEAMRTLSCPLIRLGDIKEASQIISAREMGFDALIAPVTSLTEAAMSDFTIRAQSVHMRLIPSLSSLADLEKAKAIKPRFVHVPSIADAALLAALSKVGMWIIADKQMTEKIPVKCILETP
jgi:hypothetical protein